MNLFHALALAAQAQGGQQQKEPQGQFMMMMLMIGVIFVLFYTIILRPQKREQQRVEQLRNAIKKGDKVVSVGGIHGVVTAVDTTNNIVTVQVDKNVKIDFSKAAISTVERRGDAKEGEQS